MPAPPVQPAPAGGQVWQFKVEGREELNDQAITYSWMYRLSPTVPGNPIPGAARDVQFLAAIQLFRTVILPIVSNAYTALNFVFRPIYRSLSDPHHPGKAMLQWYPSVERPALPNDVGTRGAGYDDTVMCGSVRFIPTSISRYFRSRLYIGPLVDTDVVNNQLLGAYVALAAPLLNSLATPIIDGINNATWNLTSFSGKLALGFALDPNGTLAVNYTNDITNTLLSTLPGTQLHRKVPPGGF